MEPREFRRAGRAVTEWIARYRAELASDATEVPVLARVEPGEIRARIPDEPPERGEPFDALLGDLDAVVRPGLTGWNHPGFLGYFPSSSSLPAVLAEYVAAALNQNAMLWRTSPAATELEERMVGWVRSLVGLPDVFEGVLMDTASTSTFTALVAARESLGRRIRTRGLAGRPDLPPLLLYQSEEAHSSVERAAIAAGLGGHRVRKIPTDDRYRMEPAALAARIEEDLAAGGLPTMVCATIGTTSTASVDPVEQIAGVCRAHRVWLHVDAAYAGPAACLPELADRFRGWERADSVVLNPHKWMATPIDCSVLLFRDIGVARRSLALVPPYLRSDEAAPSLMEVGLPLGRRFRALKLWFLLRWHGAGEIRAALRSHVRWAEEFAARVEGDPRFELAAPPSFSTVNFRALPPGDDEEVGEEAWNRRLLDAIESDGSVFLSHTEIDGRFALHLSVGGIETRERDVTRAFEVLDRAHRALTGRKRGTGR